MQPKLRRTAEREWSSFSGPAQPIDIVAWPVGGPARAHL